MTNNTMDFQKVHNNGKGVDKLIEITIQGTFECVSNTGIHYYISTIKIWTDDPQIVGNFEGSKNDKKIRDYIEEEFSCEVKHIEYISKN